jgi:hypothetical protein
MTNSRLTKRARQHLHEQHKARCALAGYRVVLDYTQRAPTPFSSACSLPWIAYDLHGYLSRFQTEQAAWNALWKALKSNLDVRGKP